MKDILTSLHSVAGVEGSFLADLEGNVLASTHPADFSTESLGKIAYALSLGLQSVKTQGTDVRSVYGTYLEGRVVVRPFEKGLVVVTGSTSLKQLLLKAALDKVTTELSTRDMKAQKPSQQQELQVASGRVRVDQASLDAGLVEQWQQSTQGTSAVKQVELVTAGGKAAVFNIKLRKDLGDKVEINNSAIKELGVIEGEKVVVRPVIRLSTEVEEFFG